MLASFSEPILRLWWERIPKITRRFSDLAATCLLDGVYLTRWDWLGAILPPAVLILGFWLGWKHPGFERSVTYTASLPMMGLMLAVGSMGSALGGWLGSGYMLGDFFLFARGGSNNPFIALFSVYAPLILSYILLAQLVVMIPLASQSLRQATIPRVKIGGQNLALVTLPVEAGLQAILQGILVFIWVNAIPTLIRPVFTWQGRQPSADVISPLQTNGHVLIVLAVLVAIGRVVLENHALRTDTAYRVSSIAESVAKIPVRPASLPPLMAAAIHAVFLTFMLSGIVSSVVQAFCLSVILLLIFITRRSLATQFPAWPRLMSQVPILLRLIAAGGLNFWIAGKLIEQYWSTSDNTFFPILLATGVGIILFSLFLPRPTPPPNQSPAHPTAKRSLGSSDHLLLFLASITVAIGAEQPAVLADNCGSLSDCYYVIRNAIIAGGAIAAGISLSLDLLPFIGDLKGILEGIRGKDTITGEELATWQRVLGAIPIIGRLPDIARAIAKVADGAQSAAKLASEAADIAKAAAAAGDTAKATEAAQTAAKAAEEATEAAKAIESLGDAAKASDASRAAEAANDAARAASESSVIAKTASSFAEYKEIVKNLDVSTSRNSAVFYSGAGSRQLAEEFARQNGKKTLEMTEGGRWLDQQDLFGANSPITIEQATEIWSRLSERFAQSASGNAIGFVQGARPDSIFNVIESPNLMKNPDITNLITGGF